MFNERLKEIRKEKNVTQGQVAEYIGTTRANYTGYETGARKPPHDKIIKLANFFGISTDYLLGLTDIKTPKKNLSYDQNLNSMVSDQEIHEAFQDYNCWSKEDQKELKAYLKAKKIARENKEK